VFVEVRTRADESFGPAEATITPTKRQRLIRAARYFLLAERIDDRPFRFDVVTLILGRSGKAQIRHYENAFTP
jgi:putative endonuclease